VIVIALGDEMDSDLDSDDVTDTPPIPVNVKGVSGCM
jgi:hypothetical protein